MEKEQYGFEKIPDNGGDIQTYRSGDGNLAIMECGDMAAMELSAALQEEDWQSVCRQRYHACLEQSKCKVALFIWQANEEAWFLCLSGTKRVRALEFLDYLISDFGLAKGETNCACGRIAIAILKVKMAELDITDRLAYFMKLSGRYFAETVCLDAGEYAKTHIEEIEDMPVYRKKRIAWAYVKSTDIVPTGKKLWIKSLENTSGFEMTASEDAYIMIGCRGEIYDIKKEKFEYSYDVTEDKLDLFEQMLDFLPAVETVPEGEYVALDEKANLCYPKSDAGIKACRLEHRTKIFPVGGHGTYHLGDAGDYMAVRLEDYTDIYVIQSDIFEKTYETAKQ